MKKIFFIYSFVLFAFFYSGCRKLVEIPSPITQLTDDKVFADYPTATSALLGIYAELSNSTTITVYSVLSTANAADELVDFTSTYTPFLNNSVDVNNSLNQSFWQSHYSMIYQVNALLEGVSGSGSLTAAEKNQLSGEAKFLRAYFYFQLVNLYGDVPLITTTAVNITASAPRSSKASVYLQMISDLTDAKTLLGDSYITSERVRANHSSAMALLSRVYLYTGDWMNAESAADSVIANPQYQLLNDLNSVFISNSQESILQCWVVDGYTQLAQNLVPGTSNPSEAFTTDFMDSLETGDLRINDWMDSITYSGTTYYYPFKYKQTGPGGPGSPEYQMLLRLAELYLIRAEARAMQNNISEGLDDLNIIRLRAGLPAKSVNSQTELLLAIEKERRIELFTEWSDRWFNLKRTGRINDILSKAKQNWQSYDSLFPIPVTELNANPSLTQNPGY